MANLEPRDRSIITNGIRLHYVEWGQESRQAVIMLHGGLAHARVWDNFAREAQGLYRIICLDQRGHGDSDWADNYASQEHVLDMEGIIGQLDLQQPILIGHSMGGRNAITYAFKHPGQLAKLIIVDMAPQISHRMAASSTNNPPDPGVFDSETEAVAFLQKQARYPSYETLQHAIHHSLKSREDGRLVWKWDPSMRTKPRVAEPDMWPMLQNIDCPTLMVRGNDSPAIDPEVAERMIQVLPNGKLVEIKCAEHSVHEDNPKAFNIAVLNFLGSGS
jgi:pimeloyl-ACP methyl ester carboxylesterase